VERVLTAQGYTVVLSPDGERGLETALSCPPALVILDVVLPGLNVYQVCRALRQEPATAGIPILMLTAKDEPADEYWANQVGATVFLTKPVEPSDLIDAVRDLLPDRS
jgi:twitching motility two-component system response regulator PilH